MWNSLLSTLGPCAEVIGFIVLGGSLGIATSVVFVLVIDLSLNKCSRFEHLQDQLKEANQYANELRSRINVLTGQVEAIINYPPRNEESHPRGKRK